MLAEARNELDDFVHSSKELEEELLRELERNEKLQKDLKDRCSRMEMDKDEWKVSFVLLSDYLSKHWEQVLSEATERDLHGRLGWILTILGTE